MAFGGPPAYGHSLALNEWATYPSGARRADPLAADVETVTGDMLAFATLLRPVGLPELTQGYESLSMDSSIDGPGQAVEMARECFPIGRSRCGDAGRPAGIRC